MTIGLMAAVAATIWLTLSAEPTYRATVTLMLEDKTLPLEFSPADLDRYAQEEVNARSERILVRDALAESIEDSIVGVPEADGSPLSGALLTAAEDVRVAVSNARITPPTSGDLSSVSISFSATLDHPDIGVAHRIMRAVQARFLADALSLQSRPATITGLAESRREVDQLARNISALEAEIESFEKENAAGLPELSDLNAQAMERADRERAQLDGQILTMEERRLDLDRALRDIERSAAADRASEDINPLTSQRLVALQSERAVLTGFYGADHAEARQLGVAIAELEANARERLDRATTELNAANQELTRLERIHTIDHPDVVRTAHQVSALERDVEELTIRGLTVGERRYIEGLARERQEIDSRLQELRDRQSSLRENVSAYEARALERPVLEQSYAALKARLETYRADYEVALATRDDLVFQQNVLEQTRPGILSVVAPVSTSGPLATSQPAIVAAFAGVLGAIVVLLLALILDRLDRRIASAARITALQGSPPLVEIPFIRVPVGS